MRDLDHLHELQRQYGQSCCDPYLLSPQEFPRLEERIGPDTLDADEIPRQAEPHPEGM